MSDNNFDALSKLAAKSVTRRDTVRGMVAALGGALLAAVGAKGAFAMAPRSCALCTCGVGRPCNPKTQCCVEVGRGFPSAEDQCSGRCAEAGFKFCGAGSQFHCAQGCGANAC